MHPKRRVSYEQLEGSFLCGQSDAFLALACSEEAMDLLCRAHLFDEREGVVDLFIIRHPAAISIGACGIVRRAQRGDGITGSTAQSMAVSNRRGGLCLAR